MSESERLCLAALTHYSERLRKLIYDTEIIAVENEFLKSDLIRESTVVEQLKQIIQEKGITENYETGASIFRDEHNKKIMTDALNCYIDDLEKSKVKATEKLAGCCPKFEFELVNKEIKACDDYRKALEKIP